MIKSLTSFSYFRHNHINHVIHTWLNHETFSYGTALKASGCMDALHTAAAVVADDAFLALRISVSLAAGNNLLIPDIVHCVMMHDASEWSTWTNAFVIEAIASLLGFSKLLGSSRGGNWTSVSQLLLVKGFRSTRQSTNRYHQLMRNLAITVLKKW